MTYYRIGAFIFTLDGASDVLTELKAEMASVQTEAKPDSHLSIFFQEKLPTWEYASYFAPVTASPDGFTVNRSPISYSVVPQNGHTNVYAAVDDRILKAARRHQPAWLARARNWNYLTPAQEAAKTFVYDIFDYLSQIQQLSLGQTYIHASAFTRDSRTLALLAWGGIGKTTALTKMVLENGWNYLSDDLAILDNHGKVWRTPKKLQVYAYNVEGQPLLHRALLDGRTMLDRLSWHWKRYRRGLKGVRRRISASELFGENRLATYAKLTDIIFAERTSSSTFSLTPMTKEDIAHRAASILLRELEPFGLISSAIHGSGYSHLLPTSSDLYQKSKTIILHAIEDLHPKLLRIPEKALPDDLAKYLKQILDL